MLVSPNGSLALGDVDGDGDLDLALGNKEAPSIVDVAHDILLNGGQGVFTQTTQILAGQVSGAGMAFADVDGDGDQDLFLNDHQGFLYLNDGSGSFTAAPVMPIHPLSDRPTFEDLDHDGDPDLVLLENRTIVLTNVLGGQVAWSTVPRVGMDLTMELLGEPRVSWFLAWSPNSVEIPFPPYGVIELDPSAVFLQGSGTMPAEGELFLTYPVPDNPALVGLPLHWRAIFGGPPHLSNRDVTTFTAF